MFDDSIDSLLDYYLYSDEASAADEGQFLIESSLNLQGLDQTDCCRDDALPDDTYPTT